MIADEIYFKYKGINFGIHALINSLIKVSKIIRRHTDNRKLLLICLVLLSRSFIFFRFYFLSIYGCITA
jgi:hypothetical protein